MAKTATKATPKPAASPPKQQAKKAEPAQAVATREDASLPASVNEQLPAHMRADMDMGKENIRNEDMDIPRLKLIQGLSKELTLYDDLKAGHFFHSATEMIFDDKEGFRVVPVYFERQYILWRPLENGGGILARAQDGIHWSPSEGSFDVQLDRKDGGAKVTWKVAPTVEKSGLAQWGTMDPNNPNSPPAATLMYNFLLAFPDYPDLMPAVLTFQRSSIKIGRKFITKLKTVRTPLFGTIFRLTSFVDHNAANQDFHNVNLVGAGLVEDPAQYEMYKNLYQSLAGKGMNIRDIDSLQEDADHQDGGGEADNSGKQGY